MITFTVEPKESGMTLGNIMRKRYPSVPYSRLRTVLRKRDVKIDGKRISEDIRLYSGNVVIAYVDPEVQDRKLHFRVAYENKYIVLCEKPQGVIVDGEGSLINDVRTQYPGAELLHRLDRNTGGLIFVCKKPEMTDLIAEALSARYYRKIYTARVFGDAREIGGNKLGQKRQFLPENGEPRTFTAYIEKDADEGFVTVWDKSDKGRVRIQTAFGFVSYQEMKDVSVVEAELITGKTHQIRAHLAHYGHPIVGDGKYGLEKENRRIGLKYQALWATRYEPNPAYEKTTLDQWCAENKVKITDILPKRMFESSPDFK